MAKPEKASSASTPTAAPAGQQPTGLDAALAPINEFRERADSWMKEITAQVARLAGRSEEEDRRKKAMDERLGDIENRMQSLLTLTEMVSLSKNPFAGNGRQGAAPAKDENAPASTDPTPETPAPAVAATASAADTTAAPAPMAPIERTDAPKAAPSAPSPSPPPARAHPNDARAEMRAPAATPDVRSVADTFPRPAPRSAAPPSADRTDRRYFVLEWARLLAPSAQRVDLGAFLGFYVESGWVDAATTAAVRNLTLQLMKDEHDDAPMSLEELHARSILLVSRLEGQRQAPHEARAAFDDAREAACGDWAVIQR